MKRHWFKAKRHGLGWKPATLSGWLALFFYVLSIVALWLEAERRFTSMEGRLLYVLPGFFILTILFVLLCHKTGERHHYR
jgi:hypothetical protein